MAYEPQQQMAYFQQQQQQQPQQQAFNPQASMPQQQQQQQQQQMMMPGQARQFQNAVAIPNLGMGAAPVDCPTCGSRAMTNISYHAGNTTQ